VALPTNMSFYFHNRLESFCLDGLFPSTNAEYFMIRKFFNVKSFGELTQRIHTLFLRFAADQGEVIVPVTGLGRVLDYQNYPYIPLDRDLQFHISSLDFPCRTDSFLVSTVVLFIALLKRHLFILFCFWQYFAETSVPYCLSTVCTVCTVQSVLFSV
jgi:hypothetical protein